MRHIIAHAAVAMAAAGLLASSPAHAKTCKDAVTAHARSSAQLSDANREKRAQEKAITNWGKRAADTYGWSYRFWHRAEEKTVECKGTPKSKSCSVSAKPCTLF